MVLRYKTDCEKLPKVELLWRNSDDIKCKVLEINIRSKKTVGRGTQASVGEREGWAVGR